MRRTVWRRIEVRIEEVFCPTHKNAKAYTALFPAEGEGKKRPTAERQKRDKKED
jgi:hypothetical protein